MSKLLARITILFILLFLATTVTGQELIATTIITVSSEGLETPGTISAGWNEITFENTSENPSFLIMARLDADATMDDFMEALMGMMGGDMSIIPPAIFVGSPAAAPGASLSATYNLLAGTYILLNVAGEEPQIATFEVEGEASNADYEPATDLTITLVDFAFALPTELSAREQTWLIENIGEEWHEMVFIPVPDGTTLEEAMPMLMAMEEGAGEDETEQAGSDSESEAGLPEFGFIWSPMSSGEQAWVTVDLPAGTYLVSCFIEAGEAEDHAIHAALGMMQIVTVS